MCSQTNPAPGRSLVDLRLQEIEHQVDHIVAEMPESRLEAQRLIADVFGKPPSAEMLHGFAQLAESTAKPEVLTDLERRLIVMRLLVDHELDELTREGTLDRQTLDGAGWRLPELIRRVEGFRQSPVWNASELAPTDLNHLAKLRKALMPNIEELHAFAVVVPRVARLVAAARDGRMDEIRFLDENETRLFQRTVPGAPGGRPDRILLFAAALRWAIQENLYAWAQMPASERTVDNADGLDTLKRDVNAYQALNKRMQADQDAARSAGHDDLVQDLSEAQRALFAIYLQLTAVVRNPGGEVMDPDDPAAAEARAKLLQEAQEIEESGVPRGETAKEEALLNALTAVRDGRTQAADVSLPPGARSIQRERLRQRILIGVAAVLAVTAVVVNAFLMTRGGRSTPIEIRAGEFTAAMPLNGVTPLGSTMFSEMSASAWDGMPEDERMRRLLQLGSLAQEKGFKRVLLTDDDKNELARWSARNGVRILKP